MINYVAVVINLPSRFRDITISKDRKSITIPLYTLAVAKRFIIEIRMNKEISLRLTVLSLFLGVFRVPETLRKTVDQFWLNWKETPAIDSSSRVHRSFTIILGEFSGLRAPSFPR